MSQQADVTLMGVATSDLDDVVAWIVACSRVNLHVATGLFLSAAFAASLCRAEPYRLARLEDGQVDLQGVWNLSNLIPLERLAGFDSLVISREQALSIEERILGMRVSQPTGGMDQAFDEQRTDGTGM